MGLRINTNVPSLIAQRNLRTTRGHLDTTLERLSSGSRINHAGDDAAGLAISESLRAQIRGLGQAERNAQDGVSLVQVAEGAMAEVANLLVRMRELGVQAASDTVGPQERKFLDVEFQQLMEEIDRIAHSTKYNGVPLLNGTASTFEVQVGTRNNPIVDRVKLFDGNATDINVV
ncbi:MAG: flagellin FliC, partial [Bdellovibrionota bacterium]